MSSEEVSLGTPRQAKVQLGRESPVSPSQQLADTLAGIKLSDNVEDPDTEAGSLPSLLQEVTDKLTQIQEQFFTIQEKRHAGVFALSEKESQDGSAPSSRTQDSVQGERSVALDDAMAQLNAFLESTSESMKAAELALKNLIEDEATESSDGFIPRRERTGSIASLNSLDSFDDAFLGMDMKAEKPAVLKKRYEEISLQWAKVQSEARNLEEELSGDKYILVFTSICEQMEDMMASLDKALSSCHTFLFIYHKERAEGSLAGSSSGSFARSHWTNKDDLLDEFKSVKRSFEVKKSTYGPACEQMFVSLEKGVRQRSTHNGTILRKLSEMKSRWRNLREKVAKMSKDLKVIEMSLKTTEAEGSTSLTPSKSSPNESLLTPSRHSLQSKSQLRSRNGNPTLSPTSMNRSISSSDIFADNSPSIADANGKSKLASGSLGLTTTPSPRIKPTKSANRRSISGDQRGAHSNGLATQQLYGRFNGASEALEEGDSTAIFHHYDPSADMSMEIAVENNDSSFSSSASIPKRRTSSAMGHYQRPPSVNGSYYRPPSAAGNRSEADGASRIPRLSMGRSATSNAGDRSGSALSMASTTGFGSTPNKPLSTALRGQHPPSSFRNQDRGNRLSMQTPEPMIAARAQRMNLFAPRGSNTSTTTPATSKRSSRPPPARYNVSLYGAAASNHSSSVDSNVSASRGLSASPSSSTIASVTTPSTYRGVQSTRPLTINKRSSMLALGTPSGRSTPLSAAALAKVPHAGPDFSDQLNSNTSGASASGSSVNGSRTYQNGRHYSPSAVSGRATPTFSEGGASSVWGAGGSAARRNASLYSYRPNPNDAIDVEVAAIVNSLGMAIQRIDPPLPRGVKDLTPSSTKTVKYEVGGKQIACKLLQLHRPASVQASQEKTNKVLTRVGGGWIDLRQYLLSRLGTS